MIMIIEILKDYNKILAKINWLKNSIGILNNYLDNFDEEGEQMQAQVITDMPMSFGGTNSKVEAAALSREKIIRRIKEVEIELQQEEQQIQLVHDSLKRLNEAQRFIIEQFYFNNHTHKEIMAKLGIKYYWISESTYNRWKKKAKKILEG